VPEVSIKLAHLIADPDQVDLDSNRAFRKLLEREFPRAHARLECEQLGDYALLYTWHGRDPSLQASAFLAHWDVVTVELSTAHTWTHPPFSGFIDDQFVWGRGTLDDKVSVAALLEAVERLTEQGFTPQRTLYLCFGGDEEIGGDRGAGTIAQTLTDRGIRLGAIFDEGGTVLDGFLPAVQHPVALVGIAEKGELNIKLSTVPAVDGESLPEDSARERINRAANRIDCSPFRPHLTYPVRELLRAVAPGVPWPARLLYRMPRLFSRLLLRSLAATIATSELIRTSQTVTTLSGSTPAAEPRPQPAAIVNLRTLPGVTVRSVIRRITRVVADRKIRIELLPGDEPAQPVFPDAVSAEHFLLIAQTVHRVFPEALCAPYLLNATTDSRHYLGLTRNIFRFTPLRLSIRDLRRVHGIDERVSHGNLARAVEFYTALMRKVGDSVV